MAAQVDPSKAASCGCRSGGGRRGFRTSVESGRVSGARLDIWSAAAAGRRVG